MLDSKGLYTFSARSCKDHSGSGDLSSKLRVFGEKAIARNDTVNFLCFGNLYNLLSIEIGLGVGSGKKNCFVGGSDVGRGGICFCVDCDGTKFQCFSRTDDAHRDLASIRYQ
jgi:hypothetical protein